ncbi:polysaccharide biosynthesis C-terminal domain-containing protein [Leeuwenhoekiella marinoflava]|uniref:O-antigen/teichoic acid export membrane protein n=2 Tax=Leeuwenhoekiella marinoflava TaxID=988 RepID=A0A4V1KSU5_9FLAO|nr:polysaccharide biosynthesis C-terminal domain-containing protein [Leeuwenhoekiella marinoflava]RXG32958.1 O-antigen/teichoic acid export membrane protein [Leeuwenhoekiella marinoflava]SHE33422.1 Membrane protein involved in the export of O-antigen and teichoic acid [Leeuwenhoekiella marinoflava DSM 3653]
MRNRFRNQLSKLGDLSVLRGGFQVLILRVCGVIFLFGITLFLTNFYPAEEVGAYEFTRSALFLIGGFTILGTDQSILFFSGRFSKKEQLGALFKVYFKMVLLLLAGAIVLLILAWNISDSVYKSVFNDETSGTLILKAAACLFFYAITLLNTEFFRGFALHPKSELYRGIFKQLPFGIGLLILFLLREQHYVVEVFLLSYFVLAIISSIEVFFQYKKRVQRKNQDLEIPIKSVLKATLPIAISALGFYLLISIDVFFLKRYTDFETLAYYGTSIKIIFLISTVVNTISSFIAVKIANLYAVDKQKLQALVKNGVRVIVILTTVLSVFLMLFSKSILQVFGAAYEQANSALLILITGHFLSTLCGITQVYLNMTKKQVVLQYILIFAVLLNALLNFLLIPKYGMEGAAIASALSVIFWNLLAALWVYKKDNIKIFLH